MTAFVKNAFWSMLDKFLVLFGSLVAYILVSKHLGPESFGLLSFGVTISTLGVTLSQWGSNHVIFNMAIRKPNTASTIIANSEFKRVFIYISYWIITSISIFFFLQDNTKAITLTLLILSHLFLALDIYQYYLDGSLNSKLNAKSNMVARLCSTLNRILFVFLALDTIWFVIPFFINNFMLFFLRRGYVPMSHIRKYNYNTLFRRGGYFLLAGCFAFVYTKINDLLLASTLGLQYVGLLNVALTLGYAFTFVPVSIGNTYINKCLNSRDKNNLFSYVNYIMIFSYAPIITFFYIFGNEVVDLVLSEDYKVIGSYLWVMAISGLLSSLGVINGRFIGNLEGGSRYLFFKIIFCSIISVPISYLMIAEFGLVGSFYSVLIIELLSLTILNYFFGKGLLAKLHFAIFYLNPKLVLRFVRD